MGLDCSVKLTRLMVLMFEPVYDGGRWLNRDDLGWFRVIELIAIGRRTMFGYDAQSLKHFLEI